MNIGLFLRISVWHHHDVIKWKHWICAWINDWVNNREAGDLSRHRTHYDFIVMCEQLLPLPNVYSALCNYNLSFQDRFEYCSA